MHGVKWRDRDCEVLDELSSNLYVVWHYKYVKCIIMCRLCAEHDISIQFKLNLPDYVAWRAYRVDGRQGITGSAEKSIAAGDELKALAA